MALTLYNTLGRNVQPFEPVEPAREGSRPVGFYGCGPTVYNYAHIGNLRAYVTHDVLVRSLRRLGYSVKHVMNITDVGHLSGDNDEGDDKIVRSAEERGKTVLEIAGFFTQAFFRDTERLNIVRPDVVCKATEHVRDMIELIKKIEHNGFTYSAGGNLYFDISKFPHYGELALLRGTGAAEDEAVSRTGPDENKRNAADFVLWFTKSKFENRALTWDSPWGRGYPGWHIECSAMSARYLGEQFDIHAGGIDHIPIHHTNEIAQSEAAFGKHPWVKYWVHNEFLVLDKKKMSKSDGGFITLQTLIDKGYEPLDYRYFLLGGHYRSQLQFSFAALDGAKNARKSLLDKLKRINNEGLKDKRKPEPGKEAKSRSKERAESYLNDFNKALEDDLSTPRALAALWGILKDDDISGADALAAAFSMDEVLALSLKKEVLDRQDSEPAADDPAFAAEIETLIASRAEAKNAKDFARADEIRNQLKEKGIILADSPTGTTWKKV
jgi:cysteinyl-tRNA synthetase